MPTEQDIKDEARADHDALSASHYDKTPLEREQGKAAFDQAHGTIWADMGTALVAGGYLPMPEPVFDVRAEIETLRTEVDALKASRS